MNEEQVAACRAFITAQFGEPLDDWWMGEDDTASPRTGKPVTGWYVTVHDDVLTLSWADLTPDDVLAKLYAVIGWGVMNGIIIYTPRYTLIPPWKDRPGVIHYTDNRDAAEA